MSILYTIGILLAWFVEMPLWLSITTTVLCGIGIVWRAVRLGIKLANNVNEID